MLVIGIICTLFGTTIVPVVNTHDIRTNSIQKTNHFIQIIKNGNTLYVGGSGPNNYTKIQDAINDASDGDTVFVYDDSSPYYESLVINKEINLIGENKSTTVIDGRDAGDVVYITVDWVNITGFTILSDKNFVTCIIVRGNQNNISKNTIEGKAGYGISVTGDYNCINKNCIRNNSIGIRCEGSHTIVFNNNISINSYGIHILRGKGIMGGFNEIHHNNFIANKMHAIFSWCCGIWIVDILNVANWNTNYWDGWQYDAPKPIMGYIFLINTFYPQIILPNFDWHPATEPYEWWANE